MKKIEHPLFSFEVPKTFDEYTSSEIIALSRSSQIPFTIHPHSVRLSIEDIKYFNSDEIKGTTFSEKMINYYLAEENQKDISAVEEITINGCKALTLSAKVNTKVLDKQCNLHYLFAIILIDEVDFISFMSIHEVTKDGFLEDWTKHTLNSVTVLADAKKRQADAEAYEKRLDDMLGDMGDDYSDDVDDNYSIQETKTFKSIAIPDKDNAFFTVGDFDFILVDCQMIISDYSNKLHVTIKAKAKTPKKAIKAAVLDDYEDNGEVEISIPFQGIHKNGIPTGEFQFKEGKTEAPFFLRSDIKGFDYRLDFNGNVCLKDGWFLVNGEMTKTYHDKAFPIQIAKKFDTASLGWKNYHFSSMEETTTTNPEDVRFLSLTNPSFSKFPETFLSFKSLEKLTINNHGNNEKLPFNEIPAEIGTLSKLKSIYIQKAALKTLPESIVKLKQLERLSFYNCELETIPDEIWQLPKLDYLSLDANQLSAIPEKINLPAVTTISLNNNQFKTLPESLAKQSKLTTIAIEKNPLEMLPGIFNTIATLEMAIEDKLRLLDYEYKGADGKGLVSWEDKVFYVKHDCDLLPEIKTIITKSKLQEHSTSLLSLIKKGVSFQHVEKEDYTTIGNHRFGGMPDLPEDMPYPRFGDNWHDEKEDYIHEFIGQINCTAIAHLQDYLPRKGMLFFFLETIHSVYDESDTSCKILYVEDTKTLASGKRFKFEEDDYSEMSGNEYQGHKVNAEKMSSCPDMYCRKVNTHLFEGEAETLLDNEQLLDAIYDDFEEPLIRAYPHDYAVNAYGFTQNEMPELQASLKKKGKPQDWMTLLKVTSAGDMSWGDAGDLYFVIHKSDLKKCDFSNVFVTLESS